jgi:hypothetical protein
LGIFSSYITNTLSSVWVYYFWLMEEETGELLLKQIIE